MPPATSTCGSSRRTSRAAGSSIAPIPSHDRRWMGGRMSEADRDRLRAFLAEIWADNTEAEAEALWKRRVARTPGYAAEALAALDAAIAQPPSDLRDILVTDGQIPLFHRPDARTVTPY